MLAKLQSASYVLEYCLRSWLLQFGLYSEAMYNRL